MSISLKFPDGAERSYDDGVTPLAVAEGISKSLAKKVVAAKIDGAWWDLTRPLEGGGKFELVMRDSPDGLEVLRHDAAHVMAQAVQELFPRTQVTFGPVTEDGFYYDFARAEPFSTDDFEKIEKRMKEIVDADLPIHRKVWKKEDAIAHFKSLGEIYKAETIDEVIKPGEPITVYSHGDKWGDLCRGPHLPSTGKLGKAFKLMKLAGAYWRGDQNNQQLQRIYGTAWASEDDLAAYLTRIEEAEKRDHRRIGQLMDLFHIQEEGKGMVFWHPKGWRLYRTLQNYIRRRMEAGGYDEVKTPQILDHSLWQRSGHWDKFGANMFVCTTEDGDILAVKPMNCPGHIQIFNHGQRSYRELPLRMGEFDGLHRYESSGGLHGIMRVRGLAQDDGHIFCTPSQIEAECVAFHRLALAVYADFGFTDVAVKLALRPEPRMGSDDQWDAAEHALRGALRASGAEWAELPGEGAFYGPKIEYHLKDSIGRSWQLGTMQVDFQMPGRLGAEYVAEDNTRQVPVMLHRAIVGSLERFIGILIEHHAGAFPSWLAPIQAAILTITSRQDGWAREVEARLKGAGFRVRTDLRNEKITYKIREHSLQKLPWQLIVGDKEQEAGTVAVRSRGGEDLGAMPLEAFVAHLESEVAARR